MTEHREICTGQPCGCCPSCGAWRWSGATCLGCGRGPAGATAVMAPGADRTAPKTKPTGDLVSLFDTQPPTTKRIGTGEDLI